MTSKSKKGFTLIETLLAVLLLVTAIAGPLTIASKGLFSANTARDQVTALYLAQDVVEYVRFVRDTNKLSSASDWLAGLESCKSADGSLVCKIDSVQGQVTSCPSPAVLPDGSKVCQPLSGTSLLRYNRETHSFNYGLTTLTNPITPQRFVRSVTITAPVGSNAEEARLVVTVRWDDSQTHYVIVRENLFDWQ